MRPRLRRPQLQLFATAFNEHLNLPPLLDGIVLSAITIRSPKDVSEKETPPQCRLPSDRLALPDRDTKILSALSLQKNVEGSLTIAQAREILYPSGASVAQRQSVPRK